MRTQIRRIDDPLNSFYLVIRLKLLIKRKRLSSSFKRKGRGQYIHVVDLTKSLYEFLDIIAPINTVLCE